MPSPGARLDLEVPPTRASRWRIRRPSAVAVAVAGVRGSEADAVVADVEQHDVVEVGQGEPDLRGAGVFGDVGQASWATRKSAASMSTGSGRRCPVVSTCARRPRRRRPGARQLVDRCSGRRRARAARVAAPAPSGGPRSGWTGRGSGPGRGGARQPGRPLRVFGGLELGDDPGQALGQGVVDLAGQALAFVEHAGLAGLRRPAGRAGRRSRPWSPPAGGWCRPARRSSGRGRGSAGHPVGDLDEGEHERRVDATRTTQVADPGLQRRPIRLAADLGAARIRAVRDKARPDPPRRQVVGQEVAGEGEDPVPRVDPHQKSPRARCAPTNPHRRRPPRPGWRIVRR